MDMSHNCFPCSNGYIVQEAKHTFCTDCSGNAVMIPSVMHFVQLVATICVINQSCSSWQRLPCMVTAKGDTLRQDAECYTSHNTHLYPLQENLCENCIRDCSLLQP